VRNFVRLFVFFVVVFFFVVVVVFFFFFVVVLGVALARIQLVEFFEFVRACQFLGDGYIPHDRPFSFSAPGARRINKGETRSIVSAATPSKGGSD